MKKTYSKPEIAFEDFSLSVGIAAGCEIKIGNQSEGSCGYAYPGGMGSTMFVKDGICNVVVEDSSTNGFCYHNPSAANNIFNS